MNLENFIKLNQFKKFAQPFSCEKKFIEFGCNDNIHPFNKKGCVYLWVIEKQGKPLLVIYVGKATSCSLYSRMKDGHKRGSKKGKSPKGFATSQCIRTLKAKLQDYQIYGYGRLSKQLKILNKKVSLCEAEEIALMDLFSIDNFKGLLLNSKRSKSLTKTSIHQWFNKIQTILSNKELYKFHNFYSSEVEIID